MELSEKTKTGLREARAELVTRRLELETSIECMNRLLGYTSAFAEATARPAGGLGPKTRARLRQGGGAASRIPQKATKRTKGKRNYTRKVRGSGLGANRTRQERMEQDTRPALPDLPDWMTVDEAAEKLKLSEDNAGYQIKKLVAAGTLEHNGARARGSRYRILKTLTIPEGVNVEPPGGTPADTRETRVLPLKLTLKECVRVFVETKLKGARFTRDQVQADVARQRGGGISNDEQMQVGIILEASCKLGALEYSGTGRGTIYTKH
jgi:DNA-binding Lrp family transcriptional regulator